MSDSRTKNGTRNVIFGMCSSIIILLMSFFNRSIFIHYLTIDYLGLNGLFSNILSFLALAELGVGNAINYALYKPLKNNDEKKVKSLLALYKRFYIIIGFIILTVGISLTPFLQYLIKEMPSDIPNLRLYYILYVFNSGASYFFAYKKSLLICDQKEYITTVSQLITKLTTTILQILVLIIARDYLFYLLVMVFCTILENVIISIIVDNLYPFLRNENASELSKTERNSINKNIVALIYHKIGGAIVFSSDNIIISKFVGLVSVGLYSNYTLLIGAVDTILKRIFSSLTASIGNLMTSDDKEHIEVVFYRLLFINAFVYGFATVCIYTLVNPFINLWIGDDFLLSQSVTICACVSFYLTGVRKTVLAYKDAGGIFQQDKYKSLIEALVNIVLSIPLAIKLGISGVLLGTIGSTVLVSFWYEGYVLFNTEFAKSSKQYLIKQFIYFSETIIIALVVSKICNYIPEQSIFWFILRAFICAITTLIIYIAINFKSSEFKFYKQLIYGLFQKVLNCRKQ